MSLSREQFDEVSRILNERRLNAIRARENRLLEVFDALPHIKRYYEEIASLSLKEARSRIRKDYKEAKRLNTERKKIIKRRDALLKKSGFPKDYLDVHYSCMLCKDTGFIGNEKCGCFKKIESEILNRESGLPYLLEKENFDTLDVNVYDKEHELKELLPQSITQYEYMTKKDGVIDLVKDFADDFSQDKSRNMIMFGPAGTGKTFLSNCLAKALIEKQHSVSYQRAGDMFNKMAGLSFSNKADPELLGEERHVYKSELLIIDDLGTEFTTEFSKARLFSIISDRLSNGRSTVISTNLSMNQIKDFYGERISSRLMGDYILLPFYGQDLRISRGI